MGQSIWVPLGGLWLLGMAMAVIILRNRSNLFWLGVAADTAMLAVTCGTVLAGMATLSYRSQELLGVPSYWVNIAWLLICVRAFTLFKRWNERTRPESVQEKTE